MPLLEVNHLNVGFNGKTLLENLNFSIEKGKIVWIQGESGAGKTTLLKTLSMLVEPLSGEVHLMGKTPQDLGYPAWRSQVLYQPQIPAFGEGTVFEEWKRPFSFANNNRNFSVSEAHQYLDQLGFDHEILVQKANQLSQGQQQRIAFLRSLSLKPSVLLLDEPTSALDTENKLTFESVLKSEIDKGLSCIAISHDASQVERIGGKTINIEALKAVFINYY